MSLCLNMQKDGSSVAKFIIVDFITNQIHN